MTDMIKWYGQAAIQLKGEKIVYIDPYDLPEGKCETADLILISHSHYDHCSPEDIALISGPETTILAPNDCLGKLGDNATGITAGETCTIKGVGIEAIPAYNINKAFHPKGACGLGYIVTLNNKRIYHAGDTDLIDEMRKIKVDVAILPVGGTYTMNATEAADAANLIGPELAIPIHYGSIVGSIDDAKLFKQLAKMPVEILESGQ